MLPYIVTLGLFMTYKIYVKKVLQPIKLNNEIMEMDRPSTCYFT